VNIVQVANFYAPTSGGLRVAVDRFRAGYQERGHRSTLVVPGPRDGADGSVRTLAAPRIARGTPYRIMLRKRALLRTLHELAPDGLEIHDKFLPRWISPWARSRGIPVVVVSHERLRDTLPVLLPLGPRRYPAAAGDAITRSAGRWADAVVCCSRYAAADFAGRAVIVPLAVDLDAFRAPAPGRSADGPPFELVVASRLSAEKRVDLAVDALAELRSRGVDARLTVLGAGPERAALTRRAADRPVSFRGHVPDRALVAEVLAGADVVVAPGPAETFGLAALEALACGTPIVAMAGCGAAELVEAHPDAGRAARPDPASIAAAIVEVLARPRVVRTAAARARAEQYSWASSVAGMLAVHEALGGP